MAFSSSCAAGKRHVNLLINAKYFLLNKGGCSERNQIILDLEYFRLFIEKEELSLTRIESKLEAIKKIMEINGIERSKINCSVTKEENQYIAWLQLDQLFKSSKFTKIKYKRGRI